ncbi:hypothetical protein VUR80DRAFT_6901 [Thermomyces stellatus]
MSQAWDFPVPEEGPTSIWKDLKDKVLPKHKQDTPSGICEDLKASTLSKPESQTPIEAGVHNKDPEDSNKASVPEIKFTAANSPPRPFLKPAIHQFPAPIQDGNQFEVKYTLQVPRVSYKNPDRKRERELKKDRATEDVPSDKGVETKDTQTGEQNSSVPAVEAKAPHHDSKQVPSDKFAKEKDVPAAELNAFISEMEVTVPKPDAKSTSSSGEKPDAPSIAEAKIEKAEVKDEGTEVPVSEVSGIERFELSDVEHFLRLSDNSRLRGKLEAILGEDGPGNLASLEVEDGNSHSETQGDWAAEIRAALKSGSASKDSRSDGVEMSRELRRIQAVLDTISRDYTPKAVACKYCEAGQAPAKSQSSWADEVRVSLKSGSATKPVRDSEEIGNDGPTEKPKHEVPIDFEKPESVKLKKSNSSWAAEFRATLKSAPVSKPVLNSKTGDKKPVEKAKGAETEDPTGSCFTVVETEENRARDSEPVLKETGSNEAREA